MIRVEKLKDVEGIDFEMVDLEDCRTSLAAVKTEKGFDIFCGPQQVFAIRTTEAASDALASFVILDHLSRNAGQIDLLQKGLKKHDFFRIRMQGDCAEVEADGQLYDVRWWKTHCGFLQVQHVGELPAVMIDSSEDSLTILFFVSILLLS